MNSTKERVQTTITKIDMSERDQISHDSLHAEMLEQVKRTGSSKNPRVRQLVGDMLNLSAKPKVKHLQELVGTIKKDQETVIFSRNQADHQRVMEACRSAGKVPLELTPEKDQSTEWNEGGGILAVIAKGPGTWPNLLKARKCIYFGRPANLDTFEEVRAKSVQTGRRRNLEEIHLITQNSVDETVARSIVKNG